MSLPTTATLLDAHNRILLAGLDPEPFTPTEQLLVGALLDGKLISIAGLIRAGWGLEPEQQDWHARNALRVNLNRTKPKAAAQGRRLVNRRNVGWTLTVGGSIG